MNGDDVLVVALAFMVAGFGLGMGLVAGAFVVRVIRRYMDDPPNGR